MDTKQCSKCKQIKPLDQFSKNKSMKGGYQWWCKSCMKNPVKKWSIENKKHLQEYSHQWHIDNLDRRKAARSKREKERWKNDQKRAAFRVFGHMLIELNYESSPLWWCSTPERNELTMMQMLDALYSMTDTGAELCHTLYNLTEYVVGDIVELGAGRGRTAIALGWRTGNHVISVDDFADNADWANNIYGADAKRDYLSNTHKAGVKSQLMLTDSLTAAARYTNPIGLWCWDISSRDRLLLDWQAWRDKIRGRAVIRDTFDESLGSRGVIAYEQGRGEFEIERDDPGILILRRIP